MARRVTLYSKDGEVGVVFYSLKRKGDKLIIDARALDAMRMTLVLTRGEAFGMLRMMLGRAVVSFVLLIPVHWLVRHFRMLLPAKREGS